MDDIDLNLIPEDEVLNALPKILVDMVDVISLDSIMIIINHYGGTRLFVPCQMTMQHKLVELLGQKDAGKLISYFGNEELSIPKAVKLKRLIRNRKVQSLYKDGQPIRAIARKFCLTERQVYFICRSTPHKDEGTL